jgi:hypothetical protein
MTTEKFLEAARLLGVDAHLRDDGPVVLDADPLVPAPIRWRVNELGTPALVDALQDELELAEARLPQRGIATRCDARIDGAVRTTT